MSYFCMKVGHALLHALLSCPTSMPYFWEVGHGVGHEVGHGRPRDADMQVGHAHVLLPMSYFAEVGHGSERGNASARMSYFVGRAVPSLGPRSHLAGQRRARKQCCSILPLVPAASVPLAPHCQSSPLALPTRSK